MNTELQKKLEKVKLIATDFDGVWTDGKVYTDQNGVESVLCSRKDTLRIKDVKALGIEVFVISKEQNAVVARRCEKMKVEYRHGVDDKLTLLKVLMAEKSLTQEQVVFVGDDINDFECLNYIGVPITVADGDAKCKSVAQYVTSRNGGDHAMREIFDIILSVHGK